MPNIKKQSKSQYCFEFNVSSFLSSAPIENFLFVTLTFADDVQCEKEAARRFKSFSTGVLAVRYGKRWVRVTERQQNGKVHYHLIVDAGRDVRRGFDFGSYAASKAEAKRGNKGSMYKLTRQYGESACPALRAEWEFLREMCPKYKFGRAEALPIRKTGAASARYLSDYMSKTHRSVKDKGVRLWSLGGGVLRTCKCQFSWVGNSFRQKCQAFWVLFKQSASSKWGKKWGWYLMQRDSLPPAWLWELPLGAVVNDMFACVLGDRAAYYLRNESSGRWDLIDPADFLPVPVKAPAYPPDWDDVVDTEWIYESFA